MAGAVNPYVKRRENLREIPGYEPDPRIKAEPISKGRQQRPAGRRAGKRSKRGGGAPANRGGKQPARSTRARRRAG